MERTEEVKGGLNSSRMDERTQRFGKEGGGNQWWEQTDSFLPHCYVITVRDGRGFVNQLSDIQNISICNNFSN